MRMTTRFLMRLFILVTASPFHWSLHTHCSLVYEMALYKARTTNDRFGLAVSDFLESLILPKNQRAAITTPKNLAQNVLQAWNDFLCIRKWMLKIFSEGRFDQYARGWRVPTLRQVSEACFRDIIMVPLEMEIAMAFLDLFHRYVSSRSSYNVTADERERCRKLVVKMV